MIMTAGRAILFQRLAEIEARFRVPPHDVEAEQALLGAIARQALMHSIACRDFS